MVSFTGSTAVGTRIAATVAKTARLEATARESGARVVGGGQRPDRPGFHYEPTLVTGAAQGHEIVQQEVFGPVLPIVPFDDYAQAIEYANSTVYGLTAYVCTGDVTTAMRACADLEFGEVYVNKIGPEAVQGFHHGWKQSGLGGEDGEHGYQNYVRHKTLYLGYGASA